jgi:hypothetical protein
MKTKSFLTEKHLYSVAFFCNLIGLKLGFSTDRLNKLYMAAMLHDIGKVYIPESILNKKDSLTEVEKSELKKHPIYSYKIVKDLVHGFENLSGLEKLILHHHENYDGTGYPEGIKGENIPLESRILAIADSVATTLSERGYKKPMERVINNLKFKAGKQFDPYLAQLMVDILRNKQLNQKIILTEPIITGTIELLTKQKSCQIQGTLIKTNLGHRFKISHEDCGCTKCNVPLSDIIGASFHTQENGRIYEYEALIKYKDRNKIYISKLTPKELTDYFSMFWELDGVLTFKNSVATEININKIGGNSLSFYVPASFQDVKIFNSANKITINFEDGDLQVTGKVTRIIKVDQKIFCDFKYLNILESTRDKIFKQIFKKQTEFSRELIFAK